MMTYIEVYSPFKDLSDIGSPRVVVYGYDRLPMHPPSPDYVPGPEHLPSPDYIPGPEHLPSHAYVPYVLEPAYPEFMPLEDDVLLAKEQPLPAAVSPTTNSPRYIIEFDHKEDSKEDDKDPEEDPTVTPLREIMMMRRRNPPETMTSIAMMRAATPSTYILTPQKETPPLWTPPLLPIPLPTSSPPLHLPFTNHRVYVPEVTLPPRKRLCIVIGPIFEVGECLYAPTARPTGGFRADYGFVGTLDAKIRCDPYREIDFVTTVRHDTYEIYERLDDAQDDRLLMNGQLNSLHRDRRSHAHTARLMKSEKMAPKRTTRSSPATTTTTTTPVTNVQLKALINQGVANALVARVADRSRNGKDNHDSGTSKMTSKYCPMGEIKMLEVEMWNLKVKGTDVVRYNQRFQELTLMCAKMFPEESDKIERYAGGLPNMIYGSVMASKPKTMQDAIEFTTALMDKKIRVVELTQWFERMETVFCISNCTVENQIKFATCTLLGSALTWWNFHVKTVGYDVAYAMTWKNLKKKMTDKYCPRGEIKMLEVEMWNL
nr:reverse transcriptase domain-containing protein [Tanacetum cinerariifolium]